MNILYAFPELMPMPKARAVTVANMVAALARNGAEVSFAYVPEGDRNPIEPYCPVPERGLSYVPLSWAMPLVGSGKSVRFYFSRLARYLKARVRAGIAPDWIYVRHYKLAELLVKSFPKIPVLYEAHEVHALTHTSQRDVRRIEETALKRAGMVLCISESLRQLVTKEFGLSRGLVTLPLGTTPPAQVPDKEWQVSRKRIVYTGSLGGWKGVDLLVQAAALLPPDYVISIASSDPEKVAALAGTVAPAGAQVEFLGRLDSAAVAKLLGQACIAIIPTKATIYQHVISPLKLFEYMANGCAIVATDILANRNILGADEAAWVAPDDARSLAAGIRHLVEHPDQAGAMGAKVRARAEEFSWDNRARKLIELGAAAPRGA